MRSVTQMAAQEEADEQIKAERRIEGNRIMHGICEEIAELVPAIGFVRARDFVLGRKHEQNREHGGGFHPVTDARRYDAVTHAYAAGDWPDDIRRANFGAINHQGG
jgi:hypothetical protein